MRRETLEEMKKFTPVKRHPSPFATPVVAMVVAGVIGATASYASYLRGNVFEEIDKDYRINDFKYVMNTTPLKESLQEDTWEYTVVAPTDQAFDKAQWQTAVLSEASLPANDTAPPSEPRYHDISAYDYVVTTPVYPDDVQFGKHLRMSSISGYDLVFSRVSEGVEGLRVNGAPVQTVHLADNGVVYLIDDIIAFPEQEQQISWNR